MLAHVVHFFGRELAGLIQYLFIHCDLSYIVENGCLSNQACPSARQTELSGDFFRGVGNSFEVPLSIRMGTLKHQGESGDRLVILLMKPSLLFQAGTYRPHRDERERN